MVEKPVEAKKVEVIEEEEESDVPFAIIEDVPVYPGCEKEKSNEDKKNCMNKQFAKFFQKNYDYPEAAKEAGIEGRVNVTFRIEKNGEISVIHVRGPHPSFEGAVKKSFKGLPKFTPGKQRGKPVSVTYSMPFIYKLE